MTTADDDEIESSRAPLIEHLIELRSRLIKALVAFVVMFFACFGFAKYIYNILVWPYVNAVGSPERAHLVYTHGLEYLFTQIKIAAFRRGVTVAEMLRDLLAREYADDTGSGAGARFEAELLLRVRARGSPCRRER